jgi:hypothetical protein
VNLEKGHDYQGFVRFGGEWDDVEDRDTAIPWILKLLGPKAR